jgi:hypothetical protein
MLRVYVKLESCGNVTWLKRLDSEEALRSGREWCGAVLRENASPFSVSEIEALVHDARALDFAVTLEVE